mgnify:CR=1 FL=1
MIEVADVLVLVVHHRGALQRLEPAAAFLPPDVKVVSTDGRTADAKQDFLARLKEGKGLVVMHHAIASYQKWPEYAKIIGAKYYLEKTTVNGVENGIYLKSTNANDGTLTLKVSFDVGSNLDMSNVLTQNRVSEATPQLPQSVKNYGVAVKKALAFPLMVISIKSPNGTYDNNFLSNYTTINIQDNLARIGKVRPESILPPVHEFNERYLATKREKLGHLL